MKNEQLKQEFIKKRYEQNKLDKNFLVRIFNKAGEFEEIYDKDLCCFTVDQILDMYKMFNSASLENLASINSQFGIYARYCYERNMIADGQIHFGNITLDLLANCINKNMVAQKIFTKEQIITWKDQLDNPSDRFIMLALFEGLNGKDTREITRLSINDFDFDKKIVRTCEGREVKVSSELISAAKETEEEMIYYSFGSQNRKYQLIENGRIIKDFKRTRATENDEYQNGRKIYTRVKKIFKFLTGNSTITVNDVITSGQLNFVLEDSKYLGVNPDEYIYDTKMRSRLDEQFLTPINVTIFWKKYGEYLMSSC